MLALASLQRLNAARLAARCVAVRCKSTTGIVGLPVVEDARDSLEEHYGKVLEAVQVIPESAEFRSLIEKTVNHRLGLLKSELVDEELEQELGRQLEEEIKLMQDELKLIPKMAEWKPWEVEEGHTIKVMEEVEIQEELGGAPK